MADEGKKKSSVGKTLMWLGIGAAAGGGVTIAALELTDRMRSGPEAKKVKALKPGEAVTINVKRDEKGHIVST